MTRQILWRGAHFRGVFSAGSSARTQTNHCESNDALFLHVGSSGGGGGGQTGRWIDSLMPHVCRNAARGAEVVTKSQIVFCFILFFKCELRILSFSCVDFWCDWGGRANIWVRLYRCSRSHVKIHLCCSFFLSFVHLFFYVILVRLHGSGEKRQSCSIL